MLKGHFAEDKEGSPGEECRNEVAKDIFDGLFSFHGLENRDDFDVVDTYVAFDAAHVEGSKGEAEIGCVVEPLPGTSEIDVKMLPVLGGIDNHDALDISIAASGVCSFHIDFETDVGTGVELKIQIEVGIVDIEILTEVEGYVGDGVGNVDGSVAQAGAGFVGSMFVPDDRVKEDAAGGGLEEFVYQHIGECEGVGCGEGVEP